MGRGRENCTVILLPRTVILLAPAKCLFGIARSWPWRIGNLAGCLQQSNKLVHLNLLMQVDFFFFLPKLYSFRCEEPRTID